MRRVLLLAMAGCLALAGTAYAATVVSPRYILNGKITPMKSGTRSHAIPIATQFGWTVHTVPQHHRPPLVSSYRFYFQGVRQNVRYFPACSTSTLNSTGPSGCKKGSQIGHGSLTAALGLSRNTKIAGTCNAEISIFNGGGNDIILYIYTTATMAKQCPLPAPHEFAIPVGLYRAGGGRDLVEQFSVPYRLLHPTKGVDASVVSTSVMIARRAVVVRRGHRNEVIGLFETDYCPPNHQRTVKGLFVPEHGPHIGHVATKHVACS